MQSIPLAVLKLNNIKASDFAEELHAIHTACGIETLKAFDYFNESVDCMQSIPLAVLKQVFSWKSPPHSSIACNPYRLRY